MQPCKEPGRWIYDYGNRRGYWTGPWFSWKFFFGWYQSGPIDPENNNRRVPVNLGQVGLLDRFKNTPDIKLKVASKIASITAFAQGFADECLKNGITFAVIQEHKDSFKYNFAVGSDLWIKILTGDPLVVLGSGKVDVNWSGGVYIPYGSNKLHWHVTIHFELNDEFKDPADLNNDGTPGDWPGCLPYYIKGGWDVYIEGDAH